MVLLEEDVGLFQSDAQRPAVHGLIERELDDVSEVGIVVRAQVEMGVDSRTQRGPGLRRPLERGPIRRGRGEEIRISGQCEFIDARQVYAGSSPRSGRRDQKHCEETDDTREP